MMRSSKGFTIIEMMIVIAIIGILAAIAIPNFISWLPNYRLGSAARDVLSTMQLARLRAVKENRNVCISFDTGNDSYRAFVDNNSNNSWDDGVDTIVKSGEMPAGIDMYHTTFTLAQTRFNSRGLPSVLGSVYMKNDQNNLRGIRLSSAGNLRIVNEIE